MRGDELRGRVGVAMLREALGEHVFLLGLEDGKFLDLGQVAVQARLAAERGDRRGQIAFGHDQTSLFSRIGGKPATLGFATVKRLNRCCISVGGRLSNVKLTWVTGWVKPSLAACNACRRKSSSANNERCAVLVRP